MESTGLSISVIVIVVKMVEVGKEERGTKSKLTLLLPSHHSSARKIVSGKVADQNKHKQKNSFQFLEIVDKIVKRKS